MVEPNCAHVYAIDNCGVARDLHEGIRHQFASETIVRSAILHRTDGLPVSLPHPARHFHLLNALRASGCHCLIGPEDQGFITSTGRFVDRTEARVIAVAAGQVNTEETYQPHHLFSEDVW